MNKNKLTFFNKIMVLFILGWILGFYGAVLPQIDVTVQNGAEDILKSKKIKLNVDPAFSDAVFKDHISFSIDNPFIDIQSWKVIKEPRIEYIPSFRKNKKLYFGEFEVEIELAFLSSDKDLVKKSLDESSLCFSFFMISKNGKTSPQNLFVKLSSEFREQKVEIEKKRVESDLVIQEQKLPTFEPQKTAQNFNSKTLGGFDLQNINQYVFILLISVFFILGFYFLLLFSNQKNSIFYLCAAIFFISIALCLAAKFYLMKTPWLITLVLLVPAIMCS